MKKGKEKEGKEGMLEMVESVEFWWKIIFLQPSMNNTLPCLLKRSPFFQQESTESSSQPTDMQTLLQDTDNPRLRQLLSSYKQAATILDDSARLQFQKEHSQQVRSNRLFMKQFNERRWLRKKGKKYLIDFDNEQRREMKQYFNSLDKKNCGSIGIDELEELLLSVGLLETREEIKALIDSVDEDKSGKIQFGEFLAMIQNDEGPNEEIVSFFKTVIGENSHLKTANDARKRRGLTNPHKMPKSGLTDILEKHPYPKGLSFEMMVSHIRRKHMMTALNIGHPRPHQSSCSRLSKSELRPEASETENSGQQIAKGQRVMNALQKMYERKLIVQIKQNKRASQLARTEVGKLRRTEQHPWGAFGRMTK